MSSLIPPVSDRQLPAFRESISKWASDVSRNHKPSGLAYDYSRSYELISETIPDNHLFIDLGNLRGLSAGTQNLGGYVVGLQEAEIAQAFYPVSALAAAGATFEFCEGNLVCRRKSPGKPRRGSRKATRSPNPLFNSDKRQLVRIDCRCCSK